MNKYALGWSQLQKQKKQEAFGRIIENMLETIIYVLFFLLYFGGAFYLLHLNW